MSKNPLAKGTTDTLVPLEQSPQYLQEVAELQSLLSRGKVEEARRVVRELEGRWPESELVRRFARVLAPPVARVGEGRKGLSHEQTAKGSAWLRQHGREHLGCWVILDGDQLISAHPNLRAAIEEADRRVGPEVGTLHFIPPGVDRE